MLISKEAFNSMFPTKIHLVIFIMYTLMLTAQALLVTASRHGSKAYKYNYTTVVLFTETLKLVLSSSVYIKDHSFFSLLDSIARHRWLLVLYLTPAILYTLYNNLAFLNLSTFDPTTYFMMLQLRLLLCGVIYQILFKRKLSGKQWMSLVLLTVGCILKGLGDEALASEKSPSSTNTAVQNGTNSDQHTIHNPTSPHSYITGIIFILIQILCSAVAGVYTEYLIKKEGANVHLMIQNVFMYLDSILCSVIILGVKSELVSAFTPEAIGSIMQNLVLLIILNNACLGIITSLFLKNLNSVIKSFVAAIELILTAILSVPLLGIPIHLYTVAALVIICSAVVMYAQNPIKSDGMKDEKEKSSPRDDQVSILTKT